MLLITLLSSSSAAFAQDDDDELPPGLIAEYTAAGQTVQRIDGDIAFDWRTGSPDLQLPAGPFHARWSGQILLRSEGRYRWHAYLQGRVAVRVDNRIVLEAKADEPQWVSGDETELSFGEFPLTVEFDSAGESRLMLCWSSDQFPLEPLPHHVLFHERSEIPHGSLPPGAIAVLNHRCDRCHGQLAGLTSPPGPSLVHIGVETSPDWLIDRIQHGGGNRGAMPSFGFTRDEAAAILAALETVAKPVELPPTPIPDKITEKDVAAGRELLASVGCLACHEWNQQGRKREFGGPSLDGVAKHRTARWLETWLSDPAKLNAQHRMPMFALSNDERRQIIGALVSATDRPATTQEKTTPKLETVQLGHKLIHEARCANCHELPGPQRAPELAPRWAEMKLDGSGCWDGSPTGRRPIFTGLKIEALREFLSTAAKQDIKPAVDLVGSALLVEKGCVNCHDRDGRKGISALAASLAKSVPSLEGRAPWLIPPQLTAIGDRLSEERMAKAIRGELPQRRLDWLLVRMPRYQHADAEQTALMAHLVGHDRIPENAPATPEYPRSGKQEMTQAGRELIGGKGFSCVACHPVKDFTPKQIALGTRGSNLFMIRDRLRPEYFFRWTRSPLRVMPGVEMPSYQRPHAQIFPGDLNRQLAAIWTALNDPDLPTPVNPGAVEQYWTVGPNDSPRILRDVVTLPGRKEVTVPRAFAVGFPNGHNILFDLDTASIRAWTVGDFAQQRTQGKSWFWDLVGTPVMVNAEGKSDLLVLSHESKTVLFPSAGAKVRLLTSHIHGRPAGVSFAYELRYELPAGMKGPQTKIVVQEKWTPKEASWERQLVADCNRDAQLFMKGEEFAELYLLEPARGDSTGIRMTAAVHSPTVVSPIDGRRGHQIVQSPRGSDQPNAGFGYSCDAKIVSVAPPELPALLSPTEIVTVVPGFRGKRLPYPTNIMPTAMTFDRFGKLLFTSLKGQVYRGDDKQARVFAEGLAAPFGILDSHDMVLVAHKPEVVGLVDTNDDGRADETTVIATGWGFTDDYHDWTCGLVRDAEGNLFTTLGSDYAQKGRPKERSRWRGHALKIDPAGNVESVARGLRFPTGVAMTSEQHIFVTDQQGVQNTFNELNWLNPGSSSNRDSSSTSTSNRRIPDKQSLIRDSDELRFGVPSLHEPDKDAPATPPAVQIPHPWTRSVNGICAIPKPLADRTHPKLFDQLLGCEYDNRFLVRFSWQLVDGVMQGGVYPFSKPTLSNPGSSNPGSSNPGSSSNRDSSSTPSSGRGIPDKQSLIRDSKPNPGSSSNRDSSSTPSSNGGIPDKQSLNRDSKPNPGSSSNRDSASTSNAPDESRLVKARTGIQESGFLGPLSIAVSPDGELYVGSIHDSGWQGGLNTGDIVKLTPARTWPNGLCEIRATPSGFDLEFFHPVDKARAEDKGRYQISGYTRVWQGSYATPDSGRHNADITAAKLNDAGDVVSLTLSGLKPGHVYDVSIGDIGSGEERALWPNVGYYTLHRLPK